MSIIFKVLKNTQSIPTSGKSQAFLLTDNWDDWFLNRTGFVGDFFI